MRRKNDTISMANRRSMMVLYSDSTSPIGHCVRFVLAEKNISVGINYIDGPPPKELKELNPYNKILTLVDRDLVLYNAEIIIEYLDERFPHPPLLPVDPVNRAINRQYRYRVMHDLYSVTDDLNNDNEIAAASAKKVLRDNLTAIVPIFSEQPYFMSAEFTLVDCCMAPLLWRLSQYGIKLPTSAKPLLQYAQRLFDRDAFKTSLSALEEEFNPT